MNPYSPPPEDRPVTQRPPGRVYGVLSVIFGATVLIAGLAWTQAAALVPRVADVVPLASGVGVGGEPLPPPQTAMMAAIAKGLLSVSPIERCLRWTLQAIFFVMPPWLIVLGVVQLAWARRSLWPTRVWSVTALLLLVLQLGLHLAMASRLLPLLILGPYPVLLLRVFTRRTLGGLVANQGESS